MWPVPFPFYKKKKGAGSRETTIFYDIVHLASYCYSLSGQITGGFVLNNFSDYSTPFEVHVVS